MNNKYMKVAIKESLKAFKEESFPVGAVIVKDGIIISKAYNKKYKTNIAIDHAEIIAIKKACIKLNDWRLTDCTLYVTLEPCDMCYGAIKEARMEKVIYLLNSKYNLNNTNKVNMIKMEDSFEYSEIINKFFKDKR